MRPQAISALLILGLAACEVEGSEYDYGDRLSDWEFQLISRDVGVYPDTSVLIDPNNPFRGGIQADGPLRFDAIEAGPVVGFYAFATALALIPFGENQYYTADQLKQLYLLQVPETDELAIVQDLAIRGYQNVLDEFTDTAFSFLDESGRVQFDLLVLSIRGIQDLGGVPENGWTIVVDADGNEIAVQNGGSL